MVFLILIIFLIALTPLTLVFPFMAIYNALKKHLTIFYDISDALFFFIVYGITSFVIFKVIALFDVGAVDIYDIIKVFTFETPINLPILICIAGIVLTLATVVYSFYMSLIYNRRKKFFVLTAFFGRIVMCSLLVLHAWFAFVKIAEIEFNVYVFPGTYFVIMSICVFVVIYLITMRIFIRNFKFSSMENYINIGYLRKLSVTLEEEYRKREYRYEKPDVVLSASTNKKEGSASPSKPEN